jgi:hypothetical protein
MDGSKNWLKRVFNEVQKVKFINNCGLELGSTEIHHNQSFSVCQNICACFLGKLLTANGAGQVSSKQPKFY